MKEPIDVFDYRGHVVFQIDADGQAMCWHHGCRVSCDPRRLRNSYGGDLLCPTHDARGLHGEILSYFRVNGGDTVRLVELDKNDDATFRRLFAIFGNECWWEVTEVFNQDATTEEDECSC